MYTVLQTSAEAFVGRDVDETRTVTTFSIHQEQRSHLLTLVVSKEANTLSFGVYDFGEDPVEAVFDLGSRDVFTHEELLLIGVAPRIAEQYLKLQEEAKTGTWVEYNDYNDTIDPIESFLNGGI